MLVGRRWGAALRMVASVMAVASVPVGPALAEEVVLTLRSATGAEYRVVLDTPDAPAPPSGYPVLYLLDGDLTLDTVRRLRAGQGGAEPTVMVGISHPQDRLARRYFDLSDPTPAERIPLRPGETAPETGGRDAFLAFLEAVVKPEIARRLPVDGDRQALFGHSLAGHFALHVLFTRPETFQTYVAADPAIWWNGRSILAEMAAFLEGGERPPVRVLIETAGTRVARPDMGPEALARLQALRSGPDGGDVARALAGVPGLTVSFRNRETESHGTLIAPAVADAYGFVFHGDPPTDGAVAGGGDAGPPRQSP